MKQVVEQALSVLIVALGLTAVFDLPGRWLGLTIWNFLQAAAIVGALGVLRVRDLRCYALALLSIPVLQGFIWGNATLLLVPLVALAWRWRDRWGQAGIVVGLAVASKLFAWPLIVWLVGTRRYRAAAAATAEPGRWIVPGS